MTSTYKHQLASYKDKILVSDGDSLKVFYRTDLEAFKAIKLNGTIKQLVLDDDVAYILCAKEDNAMMNKINLATWALTETNLEIEGGNNASGMYLYNDKLYIATGEVNGEAASMVVFNPTDNTSTIASAVFEGNVIVPHSVSALAGNNIIVSRGCGFIVYNLETESFGDETMMIFNEMMIPTVAVGETTDSGERFYVGYSQGMAMFESSDLTQPVMTFNAIPSAMNMMAATSQNEAPTVKKAYSYTSAIYERATSVKSCTAAKLTTCFNDAQGTGTDNIAMYIREDVEWLDLTYATNGNITPKVKYTGDVDAKTEFIFTLECIDKNGASAKTTASLSITPRIYKPAITELEITIITDSVLVGTIPVTDIFNYTASKTNLTFTTEVKNINDNNLIDNAVIDADGNLVITAVENAKGCTEIEVAQTISHKTYGTKTFSAMIPVILESKLPSSIENINSDNRNIYYFDGALFINNCGGATASIYDVAGNLINSFYVNSDNYSANLHLNHGIYIVTTNNMKAKISVK